MADSGEVMGGVSCISSNFFYYQDEGVTFDLGGTEYVFQGTLSLVPGDNLASQFLGGYKGLASALRKCRQCMAVDDDMQSKVCFSLSNGIAAFT